jgi:hypothetical protein
VPNAPLNPRRLDNFEWRPERDRLFVSGIVAELCGIRLTEAPCGSDDGEASRNGNGDNAQRDDQVPHRRSICIFFFVLDRHEGFFAIYDPRRTPAFAALIRPMVLAFYPGWFRRV